MSPLPTTTASQHHRDRQVCNEPRPASETGTEGERRQDGRRQCQSLYARGEERSHRPEDDEARRLVVDGQFLDEIDTDPAPEPLEWPGQAEHEAEGRHGDTRSGDQREQVRDPIGTRQDPGTQPQGY